MKAEVLFWVLIGIAALVAIAVVLYELRKAGGDLGGALNRAMDSLFGPSTVVLPPNLQHFVNEAVNQDGGYTPWTHTTEDDESWPPAWLKKGGG
jgi:hypothetical protein